MCTSIYIYYVYIEGLGFRVQVSREFRVLRACGLGFRELRVPLRFRDLIIRVGG